MKVVLVMFAATLPLFDRVNDCAVGALPPQSFAPKSMGAVGHPVMTPWPIVPENESDDTLVPQVTPVTEIAALAAAVVAVRLLGVKPAESVTVEPAVTAAADPPPCADSVNCGSVGAASAIMAAALPVFTSDSEIGLAWVPGPVSGKAAVVAVPAANAKVAPVGVTESGTTAVEWAASFVNRFREPVSAVPATADPGTFAVTVSDPEPPGSTERRVGDTENAPVVDAVTTRAALPELSSATVPEPDAAQFTLPMSRSVGEKTAIASPPSCPPLVSGVLSCCAPPSATVASAVASTVEPSVGAKVEGDVVGSLPELHPESPRPIARHRQANPARGLHLASTEDRLLICRAPLSSPQARS